MSKFRWIEFLATKLQSTMFQVIGAGVLVLAACRSVQEPVLDPGWSELDAAQPLGKAACIDLALRSAPNAAAWQARTRAAQAALSQAGRLPNPDLELAFEEIDAFHNHARPFVQTSSLAYALEALAGRRRKQAAANFDALAEEASLGVDRQSIAAAVSLAYDQLWFARERVDRMEDQLALARQDREATGDLIAAGLLAQVDQQKADTEVLAVQAEWAHARTDARVLELELAFALGFERPVELTLADPPAPVTDFEAFDLEGMLRTAADQRPELVAAKARYQAQLERLHLEASGLRFLPRVNLGYRTESGKPTLVGTLGVELPVFDTGKDALAAQNAALLGAAAEMRRAANQVASEVCRAEAAFRAARSYLEEYAQPLAEQRDELAIQTVELFRAGEVSFREMLSARRDAVQEQIRLLDAQAALAAARVQLEAALGSYSVPTKLAPESLPASDLER
ncbi:MAG TPA: TolC family protein [Planctomycetota bacterium]|nr:TolC family protein [Planctomycetota bacterium]